MRKTWYTKLLLILIVMSMLLTGCSNNPQNQETTSGNASTQAVETSAGTSLKDDFYNAVNAEWLASAELSGSDITVGGFMDLSDEIEETLMADFESMLKGEKEVVSEEMKSFLQYYEMAADYDTRNEQGIEPMQPYLDMIDEIGSMEEYDEVMADWSLQGMPAPLSMFVMADMGNASTNALYASAPSLYLPDVSYYEGETGELLLNYFSLTAQQLLIQSGYAEDEAAAIVEQALSFDALLVPYIKTAEESSEYVNMYNPVTFSDFTAYSSTLNLEGYVTSLVNTTPDQIIVTDPQYFEAMDGIITEENFDIMKSWMIVNTIYSMASYLSDDLRNTAASYSMIMTGQTEMEDPQVVAFNLAGNIYSMVVGNYYGETYFGEEAKEDVTKMVNNMVDVYISRLSNNDWLSSATIDAAIVKLENMAIQIGYPDTLDPLYADLKVTAKEEGGTLLGNAMEFTRLILADNFSDYGLEADRSEWSMNAATVNAMYSPMTNTITFPAAILQAPFYSIDQTPSQNYGGIGAVIAHEITHAFDNNGAQFDEYGNLENWWMEEDYAAFEVKTADMADLFEGMEHAGGTVNGRLTVSENIADAGGLSCALEVAKALPDSNLEEFFTNWAVIWRSKSTAEYEELLLSLDVHAPNKLRANVQLQNVEEFYTTFDINEGDGMYLPVDQRVSIW